MNVRCRLAMVVAVVCFTALGCGKDRQAQPVAGKAAQPAAKKQAAPVFGQEAATSSEEFNKARIRFDAETLLANYEAFGEQSAQRDAKVRVYLAEYTRSFSHPLEEGLLKRLRGLGKELSDQGCSDPLVFYLRGNILRRLGCASLSPREWFDRAVATHFDHGKAYTQLIWSLRPRWGGSYEAMYAFGLECLDTGRFETQVPNFFFKVVWDIGSELADWRAAFRPPDTYRHMKALSKGMLAEPSRESQRDYNKTVGGVIAWAAGEYQEAKRLFDELGDKVDPTLELRRLTEKPVEPEERERRNETI